ncbi:hypothetical protein [Phaeobacter sp. B1627]|uniref:DUF6902 family protein n=1 Tax=Phaeobacter sp. B1627 TaxID=2583809 RepID=UPI001118FA19|nr:hypothetical protein [Phaeobacter sp. B1627]TNJ44044.1 hypothetical protein FGE21_08760 [Phaeobacter sp. B1627]
MGQVVSFSAARARSSQALVPQLIDSFASFRKDRLDVLWLKENAELLNVLETSGCKTPMLALEPLLPFYEGSLRHLNFFRQYYRFILSICLDLEDLGLPGARAEVMADWIARQDIAAGELSDLQRAEARRLLARRGVELTGVDGLDDRLRAFMRQSRSFAVPNRKAAYELTHIVFYLTEYGRAPLALDREEHQSLLFAGLVAYLDQDADLLAEICIALVFCNETPPQDWQDWLGQRTARFTLRPAQGRVGQDDYHPYLMCNWFQRLVGREAFSQADCTGSVMIEGPRGSGALRGMSMALYTLLDEAPGGWLRVRDPLLETLSVEDRNVVHRAEHSTPLFEPFFETFARFGQVGSA